MNAAANHHAFTNHESRITNTYLIAEAGVNHNGSLDLAKALVAAAAEAGADAVKFQTFRAEALAGKGAPKAAYQQETTDARESQWAMLKRLELKRAYHFDLVEACAARGLTFLSTPFDIESADFLVQKLGLPRLKIPSGEITNGPFLLHLARLGVPLILSTGMSTLEEVQAALGVLAFGYTRPNTVRPSAKMFGEAYAAGEGRAALAEKVTLLHCTTQYPTPFEDVNLRAMDTMRAAFELPVGLSDHTPGIAVPLAAVARGASVIEKHFTLDRTLPGPDHKASLEPSELAAMVVGIRQVEAALGQPEKAPAPSERENRQVVRKSLIAARAVSQGAMWTDETLAVKRPGTGVSPMRYWDYLGRQADRDYQEDDLIA